MRQPVSARARAALALPRAVAQEEQQGFPATADATISRYDCARRSVLARALAAVVAVITWCGPVQISWQAARQSAATIATHGTSALDVLAEQRTSWLTTGRLLLRWGMQQAEAAPITDPTAPIRFTPTITQTTGQGGGVPVIQITTPNAAGLSNNVLQSLTVDSGVGLILNNSLTGGGTFLGGNVAGNPNLAGSGPASTILTQVTGTAPIRINGTVEVFGAPASVIFSAPNGVFLQGAGFTNTPKVTLTTGTPQFLNGSGATVGFDQATAVGFLVNSGRIQIDPAAGSTAGAGIEGTVGAINLIGQAIGVNAPLYAGDQINVIAGNQQVTPVATGTGRAGSDWQVTSAGTNTAATSPSAQNGLAIDATAFGAMTAGQIKLISTAQGLGVRAAGDLAANTSNVNIDANGNVSVGNVYGQQNVGITSTGAVTTGGAVKAQQDVSVASSGDLTLGSSAQAGRNLTLSSGGSVSGPGSLSATNALSVSAANSVSLGGALNGTTVAVTAQGQDGTGDITLGGNVAAPGAIALNAARDTTVNGSVVSGSDLNLSTRRNLTVNGLVGSTGGNVSLTGVTGSVTTTGNVISPGSLTVNAGTDASLGGQVLATGPASVTAQAGSITTSGQVATNSDLTLAAAQNVTIGGQAQSAGKTTITANTGSAAINGTLSSSGDAAITAGADATVRGALATNGNATVSAGNNLTLAGQAVTGGNLSATAGQTLTAGQLTYVGGNATLRGNAITIGSSTTQANTVNGTLDAAATQGLTLTGNTNAGNATLAGATVVNQGSTVAAGTTTVSGGTVTNTGTLAGNRLTLNATDLVNRGTVGGQTVKVTAANRVDNANGLIVGTQALNVTTAVLASNQGGTLFAGDLTGRSPNTGDLTVTVTGGNGSMNNAGGQLLAGNNLTVNTPNQAFDPSGSGTGTLNANGTLTLSAQSINNTGTWTVAGNNVVLNAAQGIANSGTIQKAGDLSLSTTGALANSGQIVGGANVALSAGALTNTGTVHADGNLALAGNVRNAGTAEALGNIAVTGSDYDNQGGKTQANGDIKFDISGTLNNIGSVIGANGNLHIAAQNVINDRTGPVDAGSSTAKVTNDTLLNSAIIGSYAPWVSTGSCDSCSSPYAPGATTNLTIGDLARTVNGAAVQLAVGYVGVMSGGGDNGASLNYIDMWHLLPAATSSGGGSGWTTPPPATQTVALPTIDRTIIRQADGTAGQIVAGRSMDITAASLSNKGGVIQAAGDVTLNVGALDNSRSATLVSSVTDVVNAGEYASFLATLTQIGKTDSSGAAGQFSSRQLQYGQPSGYPSSCDSCTTPVPTASAVTLNQDASGNTTSAPSQSTVTQTLGKAGQILSGGNLSLTGRGDLVNAGDLAAAGKVAITTPGTFTNQGSYAATVTSTPGCLPGSATCKEGGAHVDTLAWQQTPNTVAAGDTLTVNAANIQNNNGTLAAVGNVTLTASNGVTNRAGAIQSMAGDVTITAPTLTNTTMAPVTLHKSYGNQNPSYAGGCNAGGTYKESQCASDETTAAGPAGVISAARDVNLSGTTLTNNGALITGGRNVTVNMAGGIDNSSIALNANWHGLWVEETGLFSSDKRHTTSGVAVLGNLASGIQAGNALTVTSGGQVLNTGNLLGSSVELTSAALTNGITSPNQPTPPQTAGRQVISLGPVAAPAGNVPAVQPVSNPTVPWQFSPAIVTAPPAPNAPADTPVTWHFNAPTTGGTLTTPGSSVNSATYLNPNPATAVLAGVTPSSLLAQLPANLQPGSTPFYFDPFTEDQKLQQAALAQTGQSSFINGLTYDSQNQLSVTDQEKLILYKDAADYAKAHNIQLGQALTQQQIAELDKPMLWYVTQQVPDPNCNAVASTACPMVSALVPQLYLPAGYADGVTQPAGGTIAGTDVNLNVDGTLRNSGQIIAGDTLNVKAGTIDNAPNVVNIGTSAYKMEGGWLETTGTQVQPGGFMSAVNLNISAGAINAINDAFIVRNADGSVDQAASNALVAQLKANLGLNYTSGTVKDDIHQSFIKEESGFGPLGQVIVIVVAIALSIVTAGAGAAILAAVGSTLTGTAAAMAGAAISAAISGTLSSMVSQVILTGSLNLGAALKSGAISAVTAGLTAGATSALNLNGAGVNSIGDNISKGDWTAFQANIGQYAEASVVRSAISAGVNTVAYGGSFGQAFVGGLARDAAAVGANAVGVEAPGIGTDGATPGTIFANALGHALVGCAAASLTSGDCAGGAIGGAASAIAAPIIRDQVYADSPVLNYSDDAGRQALTVALSTMIGGALGAALGHDATVAANAAQNEALNNATSRYQNVKDPRFQSNVAALGQCVDLVACRSNAAFLEKQVSALTDTQIAGMCGSNADCVSARQQERALYQQAYGQAVAHMNPNVAARDYLTTVSQRVGAGYSTAQLDAALKRYQAGTADQSNPLDAFVTSAIVGNVALFGAVRGVTAVDSDGGGSGRPPGNTTREITNPVLEQPRVGYGEKGQGSGNKVDQTSSRKVTDGEGNPIPIYADRVGGPAAVQEFPGVPKAHGFSDIVDNYAGAAQQTALSNGAKLYQLEGSLNGVAGRYEWIVDPRLGGVTHRMFVPGGKINGVPSKP
ncbi:filamentous hemagglutinin N-terminal domain-containing protein [Ralstonia pseudosolanacearum]|uniref:two-partner secretion domain-containing protein n=1 Tax=Ralstonia pseudosolanacearum TaxID=1310165 RepID=UPI002676E2E8|nr:filamentous hemagglutinin N-terminal domain-containing protein [Ralstonia pseudosolanacearum]MDO3621702.1 filamentous hemagglutinin N-terminal domain-containing protein [Ralstonia pseudosolanacearum]